MSISTRSEVGTGQGVGTAGRGAVSTGRLFYLGVELSFLVLAAYLVCLVFYDNGMLNSDNMLPVQFFWDFVNHGYWKSFQLPRIPSLLPDMVVYFAANSLTGSFRWAMFLSGLFQVTTYVLVGGWIAARLTSTRWIRSAWLLLLVFTLSFIVDRMWKLYNDTVLLQILVPVVHFGALLSSLAAAALVVALMDKWRHVLAFALFALSFLGFLSNKMFAVNFLVPAAAALPVVAFFGGTTWRRAAALIGLSLAGAALSPLADRFITRQPDSSVDLDMTFSRLPAFLANLPNYLPLGLVITVLVPLVLWLALPLLRQPDGRKRHPTAGRTGAMARFDSAATLFIWVLSLTAVAGSMVLEVAKFEGVTPSRYVTAFIFWPPLWAAILALRLRRRPIERLSPYIATALAVTIALTSMKDRSNAFLPSILYWRDGLADCLAGKRAALGLKAGLADYWVASPAMAGLDWSMQINQVDGSGRPYYWGNNIQWYLRSNEDPNKPPEYNFIVLDKLKPAEVQALYGTPDRVSQCGNSTLWIYDDTVGFRQRLLAGASELHSLFLKAGAPVCIPGDVLPSRTGAVEGMSRVARYPHDRAEILTYGPYLALEPGKYEVSITYASEGDPSASNRWDVDILGPGSLYKAPLPDTGGQTRTLSTQLAVGHRLRNVEIRSFFSGAGSLSTDRICVRPIR